MGAQEDQQGPDAAGERPSDTYTDPLTRLGNRNRLRDKVAMLVSERAADPAPFTIALVNLDGFRPINDLFGTVGGDEILSQVAHRLKACVPEGAMVVRDRGDGFALLLPLVFEEQTAIRLGELIKDVLSAPYDLGDRNVRLSASLGFAIYPFAGDEFDALIKSAETALYRSKRQGRGAITVYSTTIAEDMRRATQLEQTLRNAIINDVIDVHFQPIVRLKDTRLVGFEALARWNDPELGFVSPAVFVPLAEERGFIDTLSEALLRKAAESMLAWPPELFLSFNLSSAQMTDPRTAVNTLAILDSVGVDPYRIELEITETAVMTSPDTARRIIAELRSAGIAIALDDFGTGQSSLGRLRDFIFDKVKIDRAFVSGIDQDRAAAHIVKAVVAMCEGLGLKTVAEGIETPEEGETLRSLGCGMAQGYFFGKPADAAATLAYIKNAGLPRAASWS
ncbi:putative bifunctional diguanylate cyclase/phosphodiesterase [Rhizobium halophytocola]|uniref:Diguanylate cyclase (GGDEF)-like protein n=1 Tax=Rhizobium halophytocola TaxID=735519 RepID=A0ABS4DXL6_9HYPH|nr:diguanylate cyclase (GGDEF)-like protein [Rhizobium halophytocola]